MTSKLTDDGYQQTKANLARLNERLARLDERADLDPLRQREARESYMQMIRQ